MSLSSCSPVPDLVGPTWVLEEEADVPPGGLTPSEVTLTFKPGGTLTGFYSHLNYSGSYARDGTSLSISGACWLSLICQAETPLAGPQSYMETLQKAESYSIDGRTLTIYAGSSQLVFTTG